MPTQALPMSAESFTAVVRVYADRVHDDVRRLGATPAEAAEIVEESALDVLEQIRRRPVDVGDVVGRWFKQARVLACRLVDADDQPRSPDPDASSDAPEGLIRDTDLDLAARRGLAALTSRDRMALLLRDAYELPEPATATALDLDVASTRSLVTRARRQFAEVSGAADGAEAALMLRGLAILALPDTERDLILARVARAASAALPREPDVLAELDEDDAPGPSWLTIAASLVVALGLGAVTGIVTGSDAAPRAAGAGPALRESIAPFDVRSGNPAFATPTATAASTAPTRTSAPATTAPATRSAPPTATAEPTATQQVVTGPPAITLSPQSGPDCTRVRVSGRNFTPGQTVIVRYDDPLGRPTPSGESGAVGTDGRFVVQFEACDPNRLPGPHRVTARAGGDEASQTFTATS